MSFITYFPVCFFVYLLSFFLFFFFFQAEDGIRDLTVTGVQTCALPIYPTALRSPGESARTVPWVPTGMKTGVSTGPWGRTRVPVRAAPQVASIVNSNTRLLMRNAEFGMRNGRASFDSAFHIPHSAFT